VKKKDLLSNVILTLLIICAGILTVKVWAFDSGMLPASSFLRELTRLENGIKYGAFVDDYEFSQSGEFFESSLLFPTDIVLCPETGSRVIPPYDMAVRSAANQSVKDIVSYVLQESDYAVSEVNYSLVREALGGRCAFVSYNYTVDFELYSRHLGLIATDMGDLGGFDSIVVSYGDGISIYFIDTEKSHLMRASCPISERATSLFSSLMAQSGGYTNCVFAYEVQDELHIDDVYAVLPTGNIYTQKLSVLKYLINDMTAQEKESRAEAALDIFDLSRSSGHWYDGGTAYSYISDEATLNVTYDGFIEYRAFNSQRGFIPEGAGDVNILDRGQIISTAASLVSQLRAGIMNESVTSVSYAGMEQNTQTGVVRVYFDYIVDGVPVYKTGGVKGYAAAVDVNDGGEIVYAKIMSDTVRYSGDWTRVMSCDELFGIIGLGTYQRISDARLLFSSEKDDTSYTAKWSLQTGGAA